MSKTLFWIGGAFAAFGLLFAGIGGWIYFSNESFANTATTAQGTVIDLSRSRSSDGDTMYTSVVEFTDASGQRHEFADGVASKPARHSRGETVQVLYAADSPQEAMIDDFTGRYLFPLAFGGFGALFALIGGGLVLSRVLRRRTIGDLRETGIAIQADFLETFRDGGVKVNGRSPYRVAAQAIHPVTGKLQRFDSEAIWVDPTAMLQGKKLRVLVDPNNANRYFVDLPDTIDDDV